MSVWDSNSSARTRGPVASKLVIGVIVAAVFMTNLDLWIVNVALPAIGFSFAGAAGNASLPNLASLSWVLNGYAVALAALLIVAGRLGDRIGHRRVFLIGIAVFTVASAICAAAPNLPLLVAARVVQAIGAAAQLPTSLALMMASVPPAKRATAARGWAAVGGLAAASGPVIGGLLIELSWRWVFVVNLPIGMVSLVIGAKLLPHPAAREREPWPDLFGAALVTVAIAALTGALVQAPAWGWASPRIGGLLGLAVLAGAVFVRRCARHRYPLLELSLFRVRQFSMANLAVFVFSIAFGIMLLSNVLWCQDVWHYSALRTGFAMVPGPFLVPIVTILTVRAMHRYGPGRLAAVGSVFFAASMLWRVLFSQVDRNYLHDLLPSMILGGIGVGLGLGSLIAAGVTGLPADRSATGSAVVNAGRQIAGAVGVALLVTLLGTQVDASSVSGFRSAWWLAFGLSLGAAALALTLRHVPVIRAKSTSIASRSEMTNVH
ncbi:MAG TPA: DHA2 family efflux MFS transporter permease subunit [Jatrophihabitans sp.]|jgi:EmrB/QacA subfamily drug resistance transporter